ncbi:MAG: hypothetical protein WA966_01900 [Ornithinimicrobium sp.]
MYVAALAMQYGKTISRMKAICPRLSLGARVDLYLHHHVSLSRLKRFSRRDGPTHDYARAETREERLVILAQDDA